MRIATFITPAVIAAGLLASTQAARAQLLDSLLPSGVPGYGTAPGVTVTSRLRPDTDPPGIRAGAFVLRPLLEESFGYDDNVLGGATKQGSVVVRTQPALLAGTNWSRDSVGLYVAADDRQDLGAPAQSRTDWTASLGAAVDLGRDRLTLAAAHFDRHQDRTELDALPSDRPVAYQVDDARANYAWSSGRWTVTPSLEASSWHFDSTSILGAPVGQSYRDRTVLQGGMTASYELAPLRDVLVVTRATGQHYTVPSAGQPMLDSTSAQILTGFDYDADAVWRLRLLAGAEHRVFTAFHSHTAAIAEAELAWQPTGMTTLTLNLHRSIEDAAQEGITGFTSTSARLSLDQELRRDVLLHASAGIQHADFLQGGPSQDGYALGTGLTWLANRNVRVSATYDLSAQQGGHVATLPLSGGYTRNQMLLTLRLGL